MKREKHPSTDRDRQKILWVALGLFLLFAILIVQYYFIQILEGEKWSRVARKQHFLVVNEPFVRGTFYSNLLVQPTHVQEPVPLVSDVRKFHLHADPQSIPAAVRAEVANTLAELLHLDPTKITSELMRKSRNRKLAMWLDNEDKERILQWWMPYAKSHRLARNALFFGGDYERSYPHGHLLGQVLQTVQKGRDEATGQAIPTGGLELTFDPFLKGKQGRRRVMRSPRNAFEIGDVLAPPENGADIHLTINHVLQAIVEEELEAGVKRAKGKGGWAVMMEPYTGEILALAQYPFFDPQRYANYFNDPEKLDDTRIKAVTDATEPGSIMKPITLAIALLANKELEARGEKALIDPEEKIPVSDGKFPGRRHPLKDIMPARFCNMNLGLQRSSNIYMATLTQRIIERLGAAWYRQALVEVFGFGIKTGLELPGETVGVVPRPGKLHPNGTLEWSVPTPYSLAMGHNLQANSIQMLRAWALIANGGYFVKPTLIRKITKGEEILLDNTASHEFPRKLDASICTRVVEALRYVTKFKRCDIPGYTEAGKTGTAEKVLQGTYARDQHLTSFMGFAPAQRPAFVLIVTVDDPEKHHYPTIGKTHLGSYTAMPIFREIGKRTLAYLGVPQDDPYGFPPGDPRYDPEKAEWVKEFQALKALFEQWQK